MSTKSIEELLKQNEYDRETLLRYAELKQRMGLSDSVDLRRENKLKTGLKDVIIKFLDEHDGFYDRTTIANAIHPQFPTDTLEVLLGKVSNALTKDRGIAKPVFCSKRVGEKKLIWSLAKKNIQE